MAQCQPLSAFDKAQGGDCDVIWPLSLKAQLPMFSNRAQYPLAQLCVCLARVVFERSLLTS